MYKQLSAFLIGACLLSIGELVAEEFVVSTPEDIEAMMAVAQPGDTLTMRNGHWTDVKIRFDGDGQAERPILLRSQTPGQVIIDGRSSIRIGGSYLVVDGLLFTDGYPINSSHVVEFRTSDSRKAKHCRLTNSAIINYNPASTATRYHWVSLYGNDNRVDHCYFSGQNHSGVTVVAWLNDDPNHHQIDHNYFGDRPEGPDNGWETIRIGDSKTSGTNSRTVVENNYFYRCDGEIEIISNKSNENVYRYNTFVDCDGQLTLRHGKRCLVEGNFFFGYNAEGSSGVRIIDRDHIVVNNYFAGLQGEIQPSDGTLGREFRGAVTIMNGIPNSPLNRYFQVTHAMLAFNTFVDCKYPIGVGVGNDDERTLPPDSCVIANNLVLSSTADTLIEYFDIPQNILYEGNIMFGADLGIVQPAGIVIEDPLLAIGEDGLHRPANGSPAINAAVGDYLDITIDMDGQNRPDSLKDVGADEVSVDSVLIRPLVRSDVVPQWVEDFITSVETGDESIPQEYALGQNYPNPFNPVTTIEYSLATTLHVKLAVYNVLGELMETLVDEARTAGRHSVVWDGSRFASGVYFYRLESGNRSMVKKLVLLK